VPEAPRLEDDALWKQRFRLPASWGIRIARFDPTRGLQTRPASGVLQLYAWDVPTGATRQLTDRPSGTAAGGLSPDGRYVYLFDDLRGNEIGHHVRVPYEGGPVEDLAPDLPAYASSGFGGSTSGNLIGFSTASLGGYRVYLLDVDADGKIGAPRLFHQASAPTFGPTCSHDGDLVVLGTNERTGTLRWSLRAFEVSSGQQIGELWDGPESNVWAAGFAPLPGDHRLLAGTNRSGYARPLIWNPVTGERIDLPLDDLKGPVRPAGWSPNGERLLLSQFSRAVCQLLTYDLVTGALRPLAHPGGTIGRAYFVSDDELFVEWQDSTHPISLIALDAATGAQTRTVLGVSDVPPARPWTSVTFASSDGQQIQGWLGVPDGDGPFPTILHTHGGPESVMTEVYSPSSQAWLDHGFAYLTINYRGSTTFGPAFREQIWGNVGHWEVEDMVAARSWLVEQGIARPDQVFLTGASYGGYLTLQALGTYPDLWAGGMASIAVADWAMAHEDTTEHLRGIRSTRFGGTPAEVPERYAASSPITYADRVRAPILIIQGRDDTRTPPRSVVAYEAKLRALGKPIEVHWFDAGHSSLDVEQRIEHQALMLRFVDCVLHGR
jgi:acetyl esterase/lipase/Tol biopolymer transport system component